MPQYLGLLFQAVYCMMGHFSHNYNRRGSKLADKKQLYVEQRKQGDYAVRKGNSKRASAVEPTQKEAIKTAEKLNPETKPKVERVRDTKRGGRDKWRKP
jgi:hypothetical protein